MQKLEQKLIEIGQFQNEYADSDIARALNSDRPLDELTRIIRDYSRELTKVKQKLEIINFSVSEQYYK